MSSQTTSIEDVVRAGRHDQVGDLGEGGDRLGDLQEPVGLAADADHRLLVEAELERIGDADDLEDAPLDQAVGPGPDGRLGDAEVGGDPGEGPAPVLLEVLDDPLVELGDVDARRGTVRPSPRLLHHRPPVFPGRAAVGAASRDRSRRAARRAANPTGRNVRRPAARARRAAAPGDPGRCVRAPDSAASGARGPRR